MSSIQKALRKAQIEKEGRQRPEVHIGFRTPTRMATFKRPVYLIIPTFITGVILAGLWFRSGPPQAPLRSKDELTKKISLTGAAALSPKKDRKKETSSPLNARDKNTKEVETNDRIKRKGFLKSPSMSKISQKGISKPPPEKGEKIKTSRPLRTRKGKALRVVGRKDRIEGKSAGVRKDEKKALGQNASKTGLHGQEAYKRAMAMHRKGEFDQAIELYHLSTKGPEPVQEAFVKLGNIYFEKKSAPEKAISYYRKALELNQNDPKAHNNLGTCYLKKGDVQGAIREYLKAIELKDDFAIAYYNMACALVKQGKFQEALSWLKKAIALNPESRRWAKEDPDFDGIRNQEGFQELLEGEKVQGKTERG